MIILESTQKLPRVKNYGTDQNPWLRHCPFLSLTSFGCPIFQDKNWIALVVFKSNFFQVFSAVEVIIQKWAN